MLRGLRHRASGHRHLLTGSVVLVLTAGAVLGIVTEILTGRRVLKSIGHHLYVLSPLARALMGREVGDTVRVAEHDMEIVAIS